MFNPYKKVKELKEKLVPLESLEKVETNSKKLQKIKDDIFWIVIELIPIENTIKYFEKKHSPSNENKRWRRRNEMFKVRN